MQGVRNDELFWNCAVHCCAGCLTPTGCNSASPVRTLSVDTAERHGVTERTSPICKKFQLAAAQGDMVADPYSPTAMAVHEEAAFVEAAASASTSSTGAEASTQEQWQREGEQQQQEEEGEQQQQLLGGYGDDELHERFDIGAAAPPEASADHGSEVCEQQQPKHLGSKSGSGAGGAPASSRPSSAADSRPGSGQGSRRSTKEQPSKRQNSIAAVDAGALLEATAAAGATQPLGRRSRSGSAHQQLPSRRGSNGSSSSRPRSSQPGSVPCTVQEGLLLHCRLAFASQAKTINISRLPSAPDSCQVGRHHPGAVTCMMKECKDCLSFVLRLLLDVQYKPLTDVPTAVLQVKASLGWDPHKQSGIRYSNS